MNILTKLSYKRKIYFFWKKKNNTLINSFFFKTPKPNFWLYTQWEFQQ
jgi:hypothetical protein